MHLKGKRLLFNELVILGLELISLVLTIVILKIYFGTFFEKSNRSVKSIISWGMYLAWQMFIGNINILPAYINVMISGLLVSIVCMNSYKGVLLQKIVFSLLINAIWMLMEFLVGYVFVFYGVNYMMPQLTGSLLSKTLTLVLIFILRIFFHSENIKSLSNKYNIVLLLLPIGSMYVVYNIFMLNVDMNNKQYINEAVISSLIVLFINIIMFSLYSRLSKEKELQRYNTVYAQQLELCTQHMKEKETVMMEFRNARHDIKQHYIVLVEMLDNKEHEVAIEYLQGLISANPFSNIGVCKTDNIVVDSLVNAKYSVAVKNKIDFMCDIHIPMQLPFENADISILLGNILDNAIEASILIEEQKRNIRFFMKYDLNALIITVVNVFSGKLLRNRQGKLITKKKEPWNHGIGLESVQKVADKYHGSVVIETKQDTFTIKIILCDLPEKLQLTS